MWAFLLQSCCWDFSSWLQAWVLQKRDNDHGFYTQESYRFLNIWFFYACMPSLPLKGEQLIFTRSHMRNWESWRGLHQSRGPWGNLVALKRPMIYPQLREARKKLIYFYYRKSSKPTLHLSWKRCEWFLKISAYKWKNQADHIMPLKLLSGDFAFTCR